MPPPACWYRSIAAFCSAFHGSPDAWNMTSASYCARSASLKTVGSSVWSEVMPASANAAWSTGVPCVIASSCRYWVVVVKIRTWAWPCSASCAADGAEPIMDSASAPPTAIANDRLDRGRQVRS